MDAIWGIFHSIILETFECHLDELVNIVPLGFAEVILLGLLHCLHTPM
jgi:hypothetical protein